MPLSVGKRAGSLSNTMSPGPRHTSVPTAGWIKMPLDTEVGFGPDDIVLDGAQLPQKKGHAPNFRLMSIVAKRSPILATAELLLKCTTGI